VLAAGALASAHLALASGLAALCPAGATIGRFLMRHRNAVAFGIFPWRPLAPPEFHKQIGVHDYYDGDRRARRPRGRLGSIQQLATPPLAVARANAARAWRPLLPFAVQHITGLLTMAEDQPCWANRIDVDRAELDADGLPRATIRHLYTPRDEAASRVLLSRAKAVLGAAGAVGFYVLPILTFSHAVGTIRMGVDPSSSPLDASCRMRGIEGLYVTDGSVLPRASGVNPSLTIAANALRVGAHLARSGLA
jgi:choline dehydrogenase-like flavoprotein